MALEFVITLLAAVAAFWHKSDTLTASLCCAWVASIFVAGQFPVQFLPFSAAIVDIVIALCGYWLWSIHESQRARIVTTLSLVKLFCHFAISSHFGEGNWYAYALLVNSFFVMQCIVAGGWFYGVVDFLNRISPRYPDRRSFSHKKNSP